jgi:hypothetical protein
VIIVENDHVIQTFTTNRADQSLGIRILPGRTKRNNNLFDSHVFKSSAKVTAVCRVSVVYQILWGFIVRESFDDLLRSPLGGRMLCDVEMNNSPTMVEYDDKTIHNSKRCRRHCKEIDSSDLAGVVSKESVPCL